MNRVIEIKKGTTHTEVSTINRLRERFISALNIYRNATSLPSYINVDGTEEEPIISFVTVESDSIRPTIYFLNMCLDVETGDFYLNSIDLGSNILVCNIVDLFKKVLEVSVSVETCIAAVEVYKLNFKLMDMYNYLYTSAGKYEGSVIRSLIEKPDKQPLSERAVTTYLAKVARSINTLKNLCKSLGESVFDFSTQSPARNLRGDDLGISSSFDNNYNFTNLGLKNPDKDSMFENAAILRTCRMVIRNSSVDSGQPGDDTALSIEASCQKEGYINRTDSLVNSTLELSSIMKDGDDIIYSSDIKESLINTKVAEILTGPELRSLIVSLKKVKLERSKSVIQKSVDTALIAKNVNIDRNSAELLLSQFVTSVKQIQKIIRRLEDI